MKSHQGWYKYLITTLFGLIGQLGCWGLMIGGQMITTLENALIIHALGAPIVFGLISYFYFRKLNYVSPTRVATIFLGVVILLDFLVVSMMINKNFDMFYSPIGTWIPFILIFTSTYLTGKYTNGRS
jgi:hypothetical protein